MSQQTGFLYYFTLTMTLLYVGLGFFFIISERVAELFPGWKHTGMGLLFIAYAGYRYMRLKRIKDSMAPRQD